jgi:acetyl esterase/lipase
MKTPFFNTGIRGVLLAVMLCEVAVGAQLRKDVAYLGDARNEKMDVYLPDNEAGDLVPAVLLIHGGGWRVGDKASSRERGIAATLSDAGYAVFSINYLLNKGERNPQTGKMVITEVAWPQSLYDCKSALRFIREKASEFNVDVSRIAVMGGSAGGHLAMLVGATAEDDEINRHGLYLDQSNHVSCIINFYGVYQTLGRRLSPLGGASEEMIARYDEMAAPATHLDAQVPPMLIVHGTKDKTVSIEQSRKLVRDLDALGIEHRFVEVPGAPHSFGLQPAQMDLRPVVLDFLRQNLGSSRGE